MTEWHSRYSLTDVLILVGTLKPQRGWSCQVRWSQTIGVLVSDDTLAVEVVRANSRSTTQAASRT